jgi:succinate-semialdehyde dehydrogenase/glutarate-semialdehyde dehydrogenase
MSASKGQTLLRQQCYVNGQWIDAAEGGTITATNLAPGKIIGTGPKLGSADAAERSSLLLRWFELILEHQPANQSGGAR